MALSFVLELLVSLFAVLRPFEGNVGMDGAVTSLISSSLFSPCA